MSDYISRADAIEAVCDKCPISFKEKCEWKDNGHCSMKVALEALPSADRPTFDKPTTKETLISREEVCKAIERYERHFNTKLETLKDLVAELPNYFTEYDTFCGVDMAEAIEVMTRYNADRPTRGRKDATEEDYAYCNDCEAVEMCMWYPYDGCIFKIQSKALSADAVQGEWRIGNTYRDGISRRLVTRLECSNCNSIVHRLVGEQFPNFCPNCGARMKGGDDE